MSAVAGMRLTQLHGEPQLTLVRRNGCFLPGNVKNPLLSKVRRHRYATLHWRLQ
jgi:hypothetical protein